MSTFNQFGQPVGDELIDWHPRQPPSRVHLHGRYCRLEPLDAGFGHDTGHGHQRLPGEGGMDGFFYARLRKA